MRLAESVARGAAVRQNAQLPEDDPNRQWDMMQAPKNPMAQPIMPPPVEVAAFPLPMKPTPPISVAPDNLKQFQSRFPGMPVRRVIGPSPL